MYRYQLDVFFFRPFFLTIILRLKKYLKTDFYHVSSIFLNFNLHQTNKRQIYLLFENQVILLTNKNGYLCFQNHKQEHFFWEELWSPF